MFELLVVPFPRTPSEHLFPYWIISLAHVGVATIIYLIYFGVLGLLVSEDNWKFVNEAGAVFGLLIMIGVGEWLIRPLIYSNNSLALGYLFEEVWHACLSGGIIYLMVMTINVNFLIKKHQKESSKFQKTASQPIASMVTIKTQTKADDFALDPMQLICVRAEGNYLNVFVKKEGHISTLLKRITLQNFCEQLEGVGYIVQTHRGFAVNVNYIQKTEGNAQGYLLKLDSIDFSVPVSRKHLNAFRALMKA